MGQISNEMYSKYGYLKFELQVLFLLWGWGGGGGGGWLNWSNSRAIFL